MGSVPEAVSTSTTVIGSIGTCKFLNRWYHTFGTGYGHLPIPNFKMQISSNSLCLLQIAIEIIVIRRLEKSSSKFTADRDRRISLLVGALVQLITITI